MVDTRTEAILAWRAAMTSLPDTVFIDLMRMYLGDIKTPFNKQTLLEQLGAFLRRPEHIASLCSYLNDDDCAVLTAVSLVSHPSVAAVTRVLTGYMSAAKVLDVLQSLSERLVLCRVMRDNVGEFMINPYAADAIAAYLIPAQLFPSYSTDAELLVSPSAVFVDDLMFAGMFCAFRSGLDIVKIDGTFKKKTHEQLELFFPSLFLKQEQMFPQPVPFIKTAFDTLFPALQNLQLLQNGDSGISANVNNWNQFASLNAQDRLFYCAAASNGRKQRPLLEQNAALLRRFVYSLPATGCTPAEIVRFFYVVQESKNSDQQPETEHKNSTRLSRLLDTAYNESDRAEKSTTLYLLSAAVSLGILCAENDRIYRNNSFFQQTQPPEPVPSGYITVDPSGVVTVFPGLPLNVLLSVMTCVKVTSVQTAGTFELTKSAVSKAYAAGQSPEDILLPLSQLSGVPVPQNISFLVHDWCASYAKTAIYSGFVLCVESEHRNVVEHSAALKQYIAKILAPGVYLLSAADPQHVFMLLRAAGIDAPDTIISGTPAAEMSQVTPFSPVTQLQPVVLATHNAVQNSTPQNNAAPDIKAMNDKIESLDIPKEQSDALQSLIQRRIILSLNQLTAGAVRFERSEARGVDFLGKVHLAETAADDGSLIEITYTDADTTKTVRGYPAVYQKKQSDILIRLYPCTDPTYNIPDQEPVIVSLARAKIVRKCPRSVFSGIITNIPPD